MEESEITDPATGSKIRISVGVRKWFRQRYENLADNRNAALNKIIANSFFKPAANKVLHHFILTQKGKKEIGEIRELSAGIYFISAIRDGYVDILKVAEAWKEVKPEKRRMDRGKLVLSKREDGMKKYALDWESIKSKILSYPLDGLDDQSRQTIQDAKKYLGLGHKFVVQNQPLPGEPKAMAYVSSDDINKDGVLDTVNIVSPVFESSFKINFPGKNISNIGAMSKEDLRDVILFAADVINHEIGGHLKGQKLKTDPNREDFGIAPESLAVQAGYSKKDKSQDILKKLAKDLKSLNKRSEAREVISLITKLAGSNTDPGSGITSGQEKVRRDYEEWRKSLREKAEKELKPFVDVDQEYPAVARTSVKPPVYVGPDISFTDEELDMGTAEDYFKRNYQGGASIPTSSPWFLTPEKTPERYPPDPKNPWLPTGVVQYRKIILNDGQEINGKFIGASKVGMEFEAVDGKQIFVNYDNIRDMTNLTKMQFDSLKLEKGGRFEDESLNKIASLQQKYESLINDQIKLPFGRYNKK